MLHGLFGVSHNVTFIVSERSYGQIIVVRGGRVVREFLDDEQDPRHNVNRGKLDIEDDSPIRNWIDAASFVDEDAIVTYPDTGLLWMFGELSQ